MTDAPLTPEELADLEAKARAATPGPWWYDVHDDPVDNVVSLENETAELARARSVDASGIVTFSHIAANSPDVTLRLIATIRAATARTEAAEKERDELREALRPFAAEWNDSWCPDANAGFRVSDDETLTGGGGCSLTAGDLSRAAQAMKGRLWS